MEVEKDRGNAYGYCAHAFYVNSPHKSRSLTAVNWQARKNLCTMTVKREQELWALALWIEREFGEDGESFIAERVLHFELKAEEGGKHLWLNVARRFVQLRSERATQRN